MAKLSVILGSVRQQRMGDRVAKWVMEYAPQVELLDLKVIDLPFYDEAKTPDELQGTYHHPQAQLWHDKIVASDQLIFITPEYNHSYPAVMKNAIDYMFNDWKGKSYIIVSYSTGPSGGMRSAMQLRGLLDYIGLDCKGELNIPFVDKGIDAKLTSRLEKLISTLTSV